MKIPGYPGWQLARALRAGNAKLFRQWGDVIRGVLDGSLRIGSRVPVVGLPVWVTPEIVRGGFATGGAGAGGPLLPHEQALGARLLGEAEGSELRGRINAWCVTEEGVAWLRQLARAGTYRLSVPEEGALMVVALLSDEAPEAAQAVLTEIAPFFDRLRFFPREVSAPRQAGVSVIPVGTARTRVAGKTTRADIRAQERALTVWLPLYDGLVDLLEEVFAGQADAGWRLRAKAWAYDCRVAADAGASRRFSDPKGAFQRCAGVLKALAEGGRAPAGDQAYAELQVRRHREKYGTGAARADYRQAQARQRPELLFDALTPVVLSRMQDLPADEGLADAEGFLGPVTGAEARPFAPEGCALPESYARIIQLAQTGSLSDLLAAGRVASPEVLAQLVPAITGEVLAARHADPVKGALAAALYEAFRRRRTLLLVNLESQVKLNELPWAAALDRQADGAQEELALATLKRLARLMAVYFPHVPLPNTMVREMQMLARQAGQSIPFTPELAADIFMDKFSPVFTTAARDAWEMFGGTLYADYFGLTAPGPDFDLHAACAARRGEPGSHNHVVNDGQLIEQQMIVTAHNLAPLFRLAGPETLDAGALALRCFEEVVWRMGLPAPRRRVELVNLKAAAYAWRQMMGFLSLLEGPAQAGAIAQVMAAEAAAPEDIRRRLKPAMTGFSNALAGRPVTQDGGRMVVGWAAGGHVLGEKD